MYVLIKERFIYEMEEHAYQEEIVGVFDNLEEVNNIANKFNTLINIEKVFFEQMLKEEAARLEYESYCYVDPDEFYQKNSKNFILFNPVSDDSWRIEKVDNDKVIEILKAINNYEKLNK